MSIIDALREALAEGPPNPTGLLVSPAVWQKVSQLAPRAIGASTSFFCGVPVTVKDDWDGDRFEVVAVRVSEDVALRHEVEELPMHEGWRIRFQELRIAEGPSYLMTRRVPPFVYSFSMSDYEMALSRSEAEAIRRHCLDEARRQRIASLEAEGFEVTPSMRPRIQQLSRTAAAISAPVSGAVRQAVDAFIEQEGERLNREALEWGTATTSSLDALRESMASIGEAFGESFSHAADAVRYALQSFESFSKTSKAEKRAKALLLRHLTTEQARTYRATGSFLVQGSRGTVYRINSHRSINVETVLGPCGISTGGPVVGSAGRLLRSRRKRIVKKARRRRGWVKCCLGRNHCDDALNSRGHVFSRDDGVDWESIPETRDRRFCLEMPGCPLPDQLLAQKLLLEADEDDFVARAREWDARTMAPSHEDCRCSIDRLTAAMCDFNDAQEEERRARQARLRTSWDSVVRTPHYGIRVEPV